MEIGLKIKKRNEVVLATKVAGPGLNWIRGGGNQYDEKNLNEAVNGSLKRLKQIISTVPTSLARKKVIFLEGLDINTKMILTGINLRIFSIH